MWVESENGIEIYSTFTALIELIFIGLA